MSLTTKSLILQQRSLCTMLTLFLPFSRNDSVSCLIIKKIFKKGEAFPPHTHHTHMPYTQTHRQKYLKEEKREGEEGACLMGSDIQQLGFLLPDLLFIPMQCFAISLTFLSFSSLSYKIEMLTLDS